MLEDEPWLPWEIDHRQDRGDAEFFYSVLARIPGALPSTTEAISSRVGFLVLAKGLCTPQSCGGAGNLPRPAGGLRPPRSARSPKIPRHGTEAFLPPTRPTMHD